MPRETNPGFDAADPRRGAPLALDAIQRFVQAVVTAGGDDVAGALDAPAARAELGAARLEDVVLPSWSLTAEERIGVYHGMYLLRMNEALESDYPVLKHVLGDEAFETLVADYVAAHPSRSYTLNRLGDHLPAFLAARGDAALADLARAELAITLSFDAEEQAPLDAAALAAIDPGAWDDVRLRPVPSLQVLEFGHDVAAALDAHREERAAARPRRRRAFMAVWRKDYTVRRESLPRGGHALLSALAAGAPLVTALSVAAPHFRAAERDERVFRYFREWIAAGMFAALEV